MRTTLGIDATAVRQVISRMISRFACPIVTVLSAVTANVVAIPRAQLSLVRYIGTAWTSVRIDYLLDAMNSEQQDPKMFRKMLNAFFDPAMQSAIAAVESEAGYYLPEYAR